MPLPDNAKQAWPPAQWKAIQQDLDEHAAWYSADPDRLRTHYANTGVGRTAESSFEPAAGGQRRTRFWSRRANDQGAAGGRVQLHVPAASDVAAVSADLLFGEPPALQIPDAHDGGDRDAMATQDRLDDLTDTTGLINTLLEAAEICAALGGVYLRPAWDTTVADHPFITSVHADRAVPEFRWGHLTAVTFWKVVRDDHGDIWRHLERHDPGMISHGLYRGRTDMLGTNIPLDRHPDTAGLDDQIPIPDGLFLPRYVPNVLPNRKHRGQPVGRSDYAGTEGLMDALDETWTSWMRDLRLGQARILVAAEYLETRGRGKGKTFDADREIFTPLDLDPTSRDRGGIEKIQFDIRWEEHQQTALDLFERIVSTGGYAPQTFGLHIEGRAESGTALRVREGRTFHTVARKQRYWAPAVNDTVGMLLRLDGTVFGRPTVPFRPACRFADAVVNDPFEEAKTLDLLARAAAISIGQRVRRAQPDLEGEELQAEIDAVLGEQGMAVADPTGAG